MGLDQYHGFGPGIRWRLSTAGVEIEGSGVERTRGAPTTVSRVWDAYGGEIDRAAKQYQVPVPLIIATICTESGGKANAVRLEPGYVSDEQTPRKMSAGLMQTLLSTARNTMKMSVGRDWLLVPGNSINAGTSYIAEQSSVTQLDPPLVAAAYNAGGLYQQDGAQNRWKLRQCPIGTSAHVDRFVKFYNDAMAVLAEKGAQCSVGQEASGSTARPESSSARTPHKAVKIRQVGPTTVSRHACDPKTMHVLDPAPSIPDRRGCEIAVSGDTRVSYFLTPPRDPDYHLEFPQEHG